MSMRMCALVWRCFPEGGPLLLAMLALADYANDQGGRIFPSMSALAAKLRCSKKAARQSVHKLIDLRLVRIVANEKGGAAGMSRKLEIDIARLKDASRAEEPLRLPPTGPVRLPQKGAVTPPAHGSPTAPARVTAPVDGSLIRQLPNPAIETTVLDRGGPRGRPKNQKTGEHGLSREAAVAMANRAGGE